MVDDVKASGFKYVLLLGMGGSSLAPEVWKKTFAKVRQNRREAGLKEPERAKEVKVIVLDRLKLVGER